MKRSERKIRRKKFKALEILAIQWGTISFMAVLVFIGMFQVDKFELKRVIVPLVRCANINAEISNYREDEYTYRGYTDTTQISNNITRLMEERRQKYYNNQDEVIAYVTTQDTFVKIFYLVMATAIVIVVTAFPVIFLWQVYGHYWKEFRRRWSRANELAKKGKSKVINFENDDDDYYTFENTIIEEI